MLRFEVRPQGLAGADARREVTASSMRRAAEIVCGRPLACSGSRERIAAAVWLVGGMPEPTYFFAVADSAAAPPTPAGSGGEIA